MCHPVVNWITDPNLYLNFSSWSHNYITLQFSNQSWDTLFLGYQPSKFAWSCQISHNVNFPRPRMFLESWGGFGNMKDSSGLISRLSHVTCISHWDFSRHDTSQVWSLLICWCKRPCFSVISLCRVSFPWVADVPNYRAWNTCEKDLL